MVGDWTGRLKALFQKTAREKADLLGPRLVYCATETVSLIIEDIGKRYSVGLRDLDNAPQFVIEVIAFYMHFIDRLSFSYLGKSKRDVFGDAFVIAVLREALRGLNPKISQSTFSDALRNTYNTRQLEYANYKELLPEKDKPLKGTLYWEVGKILFSHLKSDNPAIATELVLLMIDSTEAMLEATKVEEVLQS